MFKNLLKVLCAVFCLVSESGVGIEIGHRQPECQCKPIFSSIANPAVLRLMQFCLRTGFGESEEMFEGTEENPFGGSGQGNGWAPPGFGALSSIAVNAYKRAGGGAKITTPRSGRVFLLAAVMYVDDTDLLHWAPKARTNDKDLIKQIQRDVNLWGEIVQSTGAVVNALKSSLFLLSYKWSRGRAQLKTVKNL